MIHRNRILHTVRQGVAAMALAVCSISSFAAITFEKTFIRLPAAAFEKGIDFPLLGLHEENETRYISVRVFKWEQRDNEQIVLSPTDDFTVFPQLVRVTTDSRKTIRIKANRPLKNEKESYYRIVLEEFDRPDQTDRPQADGGASGLTIRIKPKVTVPMIVQAAKEPTAAELAQAPLQLLAIRNVPATAKTAAQTVMRLRNPGTVLVRIRSIAINPTEADAGKSVNYYVQAAGELDLPVPAVMASQDKLRLFYTFAEEPVTAARKLDGQVQ